MWEEMSSAPMSPSIVTCRADEDVGIAVQRMSEHQLHRLPVVDADDKPCGILSLNDLAVEAAKNSRIQPASGSPSKTSSRLPPCAL